MRTIEAIEREPLLDHCGIVAGFSPIDIPFFTKGIEGLSVLQTRGYDGAGFCAQTAAGVITEYKDAGMIKEVFTAQIKNRYRSLMARCWIYQVRYGTNGTFISANIQPMVAAHARTGEAVMVAHNGQFSATEGDADLVLSDTGKFAKELAQSAGSCWEERITGVLHHKKGAWALTIGTKDALYIARDAFGIRPLVYGHLWDDRVRGFIWVVASETGALDAMGVADHFELLPGTVAKISTDGLEILEKVHQRKRALCIFENVYIHHGAGKAYLPRTGIRSIKRSPTVDDVRRRSGKILAREAPLARDQVDIVIGVPGTGIEGGMSYARALDIPYFQAITDKASLPDEQRTFMSADIDGIYEKVLRHFRFDAQALKGRRVVLVDDSLVRGNIARGLVYLLKRYFHVPRVHLRMLCPPIDKPCYLGVNTRTVSELIANQCNGDIEKIRKALGADSLAYLTASGLREALTGDPNARGFCMGCMAGHRAPMDRYGHQVESPKKEKGAKTDQSIIAHPLPNFVYTQ